MTVKKERDQGLHFGGRAPQTFAPAKHSRRSPLKEALGLAKDGGELFGARRPERRRPLPTPREKGAAKVALRKRKLSASWFSVWFF